MCNAIHVKNTLLLRSSADNNFMDLDATAALLQSNACQLVPLKCYVPTFLTKTGPKYNVQLIKWRLIITIPGWYVMMELTIIWKIKLFYHINDIFLSKPETDHPCLPDDTHINDPLLSTLIQMIQVERIPTRVLVIPGHAAHHGTASGDDGSEQVNRELLCRAVSILWDCSRSFQLPLCLTHLFILTSLGCFALCCNKHVFEQNYTRFWGV